MGAGGVGPGCTGNALESSGSRAASPVANEERAYQPWWGSFVLLEGECRRWHIGPLTLWIRRARREWRVAYARSEDPFDASLSVAVPGDDEGELPDDAARLRFGFRRTGDAIQLVPALPDRTLVVKPEVPYHLMPKESARLYISSPLWLRIAVGSEPIPCHEAPIYRPSDTWFGPTNALGSLCYASRTTAQVEWSRLLRLPQRAHSVVSVRNRAASPLLLERLRLPAPNLSLFSSASNLLITEWVMLERDEDGDMAALHLGDGPPREAADAERVSGPRQQAEKGHLLRAFGGLFS